jgi:hypothetical protein
MLLRVLKGGGTSGTYETTTAAQCHSPMKFLEGQFWIYGTSRKWNLSLPFCPLCEAEALESFCRSQIIH